MLKQNYENYLRKLNFSENTIRSYLYAANDYKKRFGKITQKRISDYRDFLLENYSVKTVNLRLAGLTKYMRFLKKDKLLPKFVKEQGETYLQNVISSEDYERLKKSLEQDKRLKWLFIVCYLGSTGVRVSELIQLKVENVKQGFADIRSKGGKIRRIYIPEELKKRTLEWLMSEKRNDGYLFLNKFGLQISTRGISAELQHFSSIYNINHKTLHPHSFRHFFAKNFLEKGGDITFLADLLGHESLETTRIYLRKSIEEQKKIVNTIVKW